MKISFAPLLCVIWLTVTTNTSALMAELTEPGVAHSTDYPKAAQEQVAAALKRPDCKFLKGHFINSHTSLLYAGETKALNLFLDALAQCPGVTLHVSFVADPIPGEPCDWAVSHDAHANSFHVRVNLNSPHVKLPDIYLPEVKGPPWQRVASLTQGELVGEWSGPCIGFKLAANGTGAWRVKDASGPLSKPEPFKWKWSDSTLRLRGATGEQSLAVTRAEGDSLALTFQNGNALHVWKVAPPADRRRPLGRNDR